MWLNSIFLLSPKSGLELLSLSPLSLGIGIILRTLLKLALIRDPFGSGISTSSSPRCIEMESKSVLLRLWSVNFSKCLYSSVSNCSLVGFLYNFNNNEEQTTDTEEAAIAADPNHGLITIPQGRKMPAANGMPNKLYTLANIKFNRMRRTVRCDKSMAPTTSRRSFFKHKSIR